MTLRSEIGIDARAHLRALIVCPHCDGLFISKQLQAGDCARCPDCHEPLQGHRSPSRELVLACALAGAMLLVIAVASPVLSASFGSVTTEVNVSRRPMPPCRSCERSQATYDAIRIPCFEAAGQVLRIETMNAAHLRYPLILMVGLFAGCKSATVHLYTLEPDSTANPSQIPATPLKDTFILEQVLIPRQIDRKELILRTSARELKLLENDNPRLGVDDTRSDAQGRMETEALRYHGAPRDPLRERLLGKHHR